MDVAERDKRFVARAEPADGVQVARADGCFVFDHHGKKYVDFTAGWCVGNLGWGNDEVRAAIRAFDGPTYVHPDHLYRPWAELAEALAGIVPVKRAKCSRATGGSEAVEIALQVAMAATGRPGLSPWKTATTATHSGRGALPGTATSTLTCSPTATGSGRRWTTGPRAGWSGCSGAGRSRHSSWSRWSATSGC